MNRRQVSFVLASAVVLGGFQGCGTCGHRCGYLSTPRTAVTPPCDRCGPGAPLPPPANPVPAPAVPAPAAPAVVAPPPGGEMQQNSYIPSGPPSSVAPPSGAPGVYLAPPEPVDAEARPLPADSNSARDSTRLYPPQTSEPPLAPRMPPAKDDQAASPAMPVDIPQFAVAKPNVATGQEPFAEGVPWLKVHGYRTVLHIRAPGEDDSAARRSFEQNGLRYLSLKVSPQTLSKAIVDEFNRLVTDAKNQPLFVYDKDGSLAGGLWYLHFRLVAKETDEKARADAAQLGFKQDQEGPHRTMWIAVQNFLQNVKP